MKRVIARMFMGMMAGAAGLSLYGAASAQVQFPGNPTSISQCEAAMERATALYMNHSRLQDMYSAQRKQVDNQLSNSCRGSRDFSRCAEPYRQQMHALYEKSSGHYHEYVRIKGEAVRQNNACRSVARAHEQQVEQQRAMAEENRRSQERRTEEQRRNAEQNERRAQEENNRREYEARQRQANAAQLEAQRVQQERNQPRVIAQTNPGYYDNRNAQRIVQTPEQAARSRAEAQQQLQQQQQAQLTRDALTQLGNMVDAASNPPNPQQPVGPQMDRARRLAGENDEARRRMLDIPLNPQGHQNSQLNSTVRDVQEVNQRMNRGGPAVTQIQNDAYAATGSVTNNALGQFDQAMSVTAQNAGDGSRGSGASSQYVPRPTPQAPVQVASAPASPETACGRRVLFALNQCMARECEKPQFKGHPQCKAFEPVVSRD